MAKTSSLTGTGKKNLKKVQKAQGYLAEQAVKESLEGFPYKKGALHAIKQIQKGRHAPTYKGKTEYEPSKFTPETRYKETGFKPKAKYEETGFKPKTTYEPSKFTQQTQYQHRTLTDLQKDYARAGEGLEPLFEKRKQAVLADFTQNVAPQISASAGSADSGKSSAVRQALAAAHGNLARNLSADFESMRNNIAGNLLGERERQRQFGSQFGAGQEQFYNQLKNQQQQFGSQFGSEQERYAAGLRAQERQFGSQFGSEQERYAAGLRAQERQFGSQFGGAQEQFGAQLRNQERQFGANFGLSQEQARYNSQLQALQARLSASGALLGTPTQANFSPLQSQYNPSGPSSPSIGSRIGSSLLQGAIGGLTGGPGGSVAGGISGLFSPAPRAANSPFGGAGFGGAQPGFF